MSRYRTLFTFLSCLFLLLQTGSAQTGTISIVIEPRKTPQVKRDQPEPSFVPLSNPVFAARTSGSLTVTTTITGATCQRTDGSLVASASNGTPPYTYEINNYGQRHYGYYPMLSPGTYSLTVRDAAGAVDVTSITIPNTFSAPVVYRSGSTNTSSCTATDGTITVTASGGTPPYSFSKDNVNWQSSNVFNNMSGGIYQFLVKDANGCKTGNLDNFYSGWGCQFSKGINWSQSVCRDEGFLHITAGQGVAPYSYSLDNITYTNTGLFENLTAGLYTVYMKDATGRLETFTLNSHQLCMPKATATPAHCHQSDGSITVTPQTGTAPFSYTIDGINFQAANVFSGLAAGWYYITVKDATGMSSSLQAEITEDCPQVSVTATSESCGSANAVITATARNGKAPYLYSLDGVNFQTGNSFSGLAAGSYTVSVKDADGYTGTTAVTIKNNCLTLAVTPTHVICSYHNGKIQVTATGGTPPYQYSLDGVNFQPGNEFTSLEKGTYTVTVKDAAGVSKNIVTTINDSPSPTFTFTTTPASCSGNDGSITVHATGSAPFQYSIRYLDYQTRNVFTGLAPGIYLVNVTDANGCNILMTEHVSWYCLSAVATTTDASCGNSDGTITVSANNGTAPYEYSTDGTNYQLNNGFTGLNAGMYTVYVRDSKGTVKTTTATVNISCITINVSSSAESCNQRNGSILVSAGNGTAPYRFSIDGINFQLDGKFNNLASGAYTITVKDSKGGTNTANVVVKATGGPQITSLPISAASCQGMDGRVDILATGGTPPLLYALNNTSLTSVNHFINQAPGTYTARVVDANGCETSSPVAIPLNNTLTVDAGNDRTICEGKTVQLQATSNGIGFSWAPASSLGNASVGSPVASPLITTKYYVTATAGPCTERDSVTVFVLPAPRASVNPDVTICYGQSAILNASGGTKASWSPGTYLDDPYSYSPRVVTPRSSIRYELTVTDGNGCQSTVPASVTVSVTPPANVSAGSDTVIVAGQPFQLHAIDVNGSGFTQYKWSPAVGLNDAFLKDPLVTINQAATYTVTATTAAGCQGNDLINIKVYPGPEIYVPNAFTPNADGRNDVLKPVVVGIREFRYFAIYNRWGQEVFKTTNAGQGWNGQLQGSIPATGTFVWRAGGRDQAGRLVERKGVVVLIR